MIISSEIKKEILDIIFQYLHKNNITVFIFGSYSQGTAKQSSDIDIGVISIENISLDAILTIKQDLNEKVNVLRDIDLVNFSDKNLDKEFVRISLKDFEIWHKTKDSSEILNSLIKPL